MPSESLDDPTISNPLAQPPNTTTYTVTVTDADGVTLTGSVQVRVFLLITAISANPDTVDPGQTSSLHVDIEGGTLPLTINWTPADTIISGQGTADAVCQPTAITTYTANVVDADGFTTSASVTVNVHSAQPPPTAAFSFTRVPCSSTTLCSNGATAGQEVFLDGSASTGNIVSYSWEFDWTPTSPDAVSSGPTTSVVLPEGNQRGNIILTVTAADGRTVSASRRFP